MWSKQITTLLWSLFALLLSSLVTACVGTKSNEDMGKGDKTHTHPTHTAVARNWEDILASDTLIVGSITSPTEFFLYRGEPMGIEYSKIEAFAQAHNLSTQVLVTSSLDSLQQWVKDGMVDLSITPFSMSRIYSENFLFTGMIDTLSLVLAQHKASNRVERLTDLHNRRLTVIPNTVYEQRAHQIVKELGDTTVQVLTVDTLGIEDLLKQIATVESERTVTLVESDLGKVYSNQYRNLDTSVRASLPIRYSWITHLKNETLRDSINHFFSDSTRILHFRRLALLDNAYRYYFTKSSTTYQIKAGILSPFDELFKSEAKSLGWHWTVLASIAYQESTFRSEVIGWSGARGLMGIMPSTGRLYGVSAEQLLDPEISVKVATDLLSSLLPAFSDIKGDADRVSFVLAAYNAGLGHVQDAQRLAKKYGANPKLWHGNVRNYILLKSNPKYYNDPVVKYGYVRGRETVKYVDDIQNRSRSYRSMIH